MHSDPEHRISASQTRSKPLFVPAAMIALVLSAGIYYATRSDMAQVEPAPPAPVPPPVASKPEPPPLPPAPDIPEPPQPAVEPAAQPAVEAVTVEESDALLRQSFGGDDAPALLQGALANDNLVERTASLVDSLSRGALPYKALPIKRPAGKFSVITRGGETLMDPAGYRRYDNYAAAISALDPSTLAATFTRFRALLEQAYAALGYPPGDFDNALIRALDRVLATPRLDEPPRLKRKEAVYVYTDPQLEQLTDIQKLLLRTGPDNTSRIQDQARQLRGALLGADRQ